MKNLVSQIETGERLVRQKRPPEKENNGPDKRHFDTQPVLKTLESVSFCKVRTYGIVSFKKDLNGRANGYICLI